MFTDILCQVASQVFIPLTVGGGINTVDDFDRVLKCGVGSGDHGDAHAVSKNVIGVGAVNLVVKNVSDCIVDVIDPHYFQRECTEKSGKGLSAKHGILACLLYFCCYALGK